MAIAQMRRMGTLPTVKTTGGHWSRRIVSGFKREGDFLRPIPDLIQRKALPRATPSVGTCEFKRIGVIHVAGA